MRCLLCNVATNSRLAVNDQVRLQRRSEERTTLNVADTVTQERTSALNVERSGLICGLEGIKTGMTTGMTTGVKTDTKTDTGPTTPTSGAEGGPIRPRSNVVLRNRSLAFTGLFGSGGDPLRKALLSDQKFEP